MKKNFNVKNIIFMLVLIMITAFGIKTVDAAGVAPDTLKMKYRNYTPPISFPQTFHIKETTKGEYVYCATYAKNMPVTSIKYTKASKYKDPGINYILEEGYKAKNDKQYFIAQTAFWIYLMDKDQMDYSYSVNKFKSSISGSSNATAKKIRQMVDKAKSLKSYDQENPTIKFTSGDITFNLSDDKSYYTSNKITIKSSQSSYKAELVNAPSGAYIQDNKNGELYVIVPAKSVGTTKATFSIKVSNTKTIYKSYKYTPNNSSYQTMSATYAIEKNAEASKSMSLVVDKVTISKQDVTTKAELPGATLQIKDSSGNVVDSWISGNTAHEVSLAPGTYTLVETVAPEGYDLSTESVTFTVTNKGVTTPVVMYNSPSKTTVPTVTISKQDITTKTELPGATLEIRDSSGKVVKTWESTATPYVITDLAPDKYTLVETKAPEGYKLSSEQIEFEVTANGTEKPIVMYNAPEEEIEYKVLINKLDSETKEQIAGATLKIYDIEGNVVETITSETTATTITGLKPGTYTLVETEAPEGYVLSTEQVSFTIEEGKEETVSVTMYNSKDNKDTPAQEVEVPSTSSFKTLASSMIGGIVLLVGSVLIAKNLKKKYEN